MKFLSHILLLGLMPIIIGSILGGAAVWAVPPVQAYNTCWHPSGYCGSAYYSSVSWYDDTGFSGSSATAVNDSGTAWNNGGYVGVNRTSGAPFNAYVGYMNIGVPNAPGRTDAYFNASDPYEIIYNEIYLNSFYAWFTSGASWTMHQWTPSQQWAYADIKTITVHEMGHMLGLAHACNSSSAVMCVTWTVKWSPVTDDWNGINALY